MAESGFNFQFAFRNNHSDPCNNGDWNNRGNEKIDFFKPHRLSHEYHSVEYIFKCVLRLRHISSNIDRFDCSHFTHRIHPFWNLKSIQGGRIKIEFVCSD